MLSQLSVAALFAAGTVSASPIVSRAEATVVKSYGNWTQQGCYSDLLYGSRALGNRLAQAPQTVDGCLDSCSSAGYELCGVEWTGECWGDNTLSSWSTSQGAAACTITCAGNSTQLCGGTGGPAGATFQLYSKAALPSTNVTVPTEPTVPTTPTTPVTNATAVNNYTASGSLWSRQGCYPDQMYGSRALPNLLAYGQPQTVEGCLATCQDKGFDLCGVEYRGECWGANSIADWSYKLDDSACELTCADNTSELCGGTGGPHYEKSTFQYYKRSNCPANAATCSSSTVATSCSGDYVLYNGKCESKTCPQKYYADSKNVCKQCSDPNALTCTATKSLTCGVNRMLIESTGRCTTTSNCIYAPYTDATTGTYIPGSYNDFKGNCLSCAPAAYQCDANGAQFCYNYNGVQYYRALNGKCLTASECKAFKPTSTLYTQLQSRTGVTYGTC